MSIITSISCSEYLRHKENILLSAVQKNVVALASNAFEALRRLMINALCAYVEPLLDIYHFAYTRKNNESEAMSVLMHVT